MKAIILSILLSAMSQFASANEDKNYIECSDKAGNMSDRAQSVPPNSHESVPPLA
jgi:hypothetical protein